MRQHEFGDGQLGDGATPLMRAAKASDPASMALLLDKGADPNRAMKNGTTALMIAASRPGRSTTVDQTVAALKVLLDHRADVNAATPDGATALHQAVGRGDEIVKFLVEKGAKLDAKDKQGRTPIEWADGLYRGGGIAPVTNFETVALLKQLSK